MQSERRRIQNPFKYLRWSTFAKTVNGLKSLTGHAKTPFYMFERVLNMPLLSKKADVRCAKKTLDAAN